MPRRNSRVRHEPLDLTPADLPPNRTIPRTSRERLHQESELAKRQRVARMKNGIDWTVCLVPGCGETLMAHHLLVPADKRDTNETLPLCLNHAVAIWQQVQNNRGLPEVVETAEQRHARHVAEAQERVVVRAAARKADRNGHMYFVQINDLVKIGWTKNLPRRLKEYGAGAVLLCHYPATSDDETHLHRQLRDHLAKGREWYHDGPAIRLYVDRALEEHGPPTAEAFWTKPKPPVIRQRARR